MRHWVAVSLAAAEAASGDHETAEQRLAVVLDDTADDPDSDLLWASAAAQLGFLHLHRGDAVTALALYDDAIGALRATGADDALLARALGNAGYCSLMLGRLQVAERYWDESSHCARATGQLLVLAGNTQNLAYTRMCLGDLPGSIEQGGRALDLYRELGQAGRNLATLYDDLAEIHRFAGLTRDALRFARLSLWVARQPCSPPPVVRSGCSGLDCWRWRLRRPN